MGFYNFLTEVIFSVGLLARIFNSNAIKDLNLEKIDSKRNLLSGKLIAAKSQEYTAKYHPKPPKLPTFSTLFKFSVSFWAMSYNVI